MGRAIASREGGGLGRAVGDVPTGSSDHPGEAMNMPPELQAMLGMLSADEYLAATDELQAEADLYCGNGLHLMTSENTAIRHEKASKTPNRRCRECERISRRKSRLAAALL